MSYAVEFSLKSGKFAKYGVVNYETKYSPYVSEGYLVVEKTDGEVLFVKETLLEYFAFKKGNE